MNKLLKKVPTLVVIGATGFAAWPILFPEPEPAIPKAMARPPAPPVAAVPPASASKRDPFRLAPAPPEPAPNALAAGAAPGAARGSAPVAPRDEAEEALAGLRLTGTFIEGRDQLAVIAGKVYARGEQVLDADGAPGLFRVAEIRTDRVVLLQGRRRHVLEFANNRPKPVATASMASQAAPMPAGMGFPAGPGDAGGPGGRDAVVGGPSPGPDDPRSLILKLVSGLASSGTPDGPGAAPGGVGAAGMSPAGLAGLLPPGIDPKMFGAGLDALIGRYDDVGKAGGAAGLGGIGP